MPVCGRLVRAQDVAHVVATEHVSSGWRLGRSIRSWHIPTPAAIAKQAPTWTPLVGDGDVDIATRWLIDGLGGTRA